MSLRARVTEEENGAVLVMVLAFFPVLIVMVIFVIDVANWFEHKRHLQLQADAGALAAAGGVICPGSDALIEQRARNYSGDVHNEQVSGTQSSVHFLLNSPTYYNQSTPVDATVVEGGACDAAMIDVKLTETDLPFFLQVADLIPGTPEIVPFINAHARVSFKQTSQATGALPVGVPDVNPQSARIEFVDEGTGAVIASGALSPQGSADGLAIWESAALPVTVNRERIGVRVALGGGASTTCGDPLVECYDLGSQNGLVHIRGWLAAGSGAQPAAPVARSVNLVPGSCTDAYFSAASATCTIGVQAKVDFGPSDPVAAVGAIVRANVGGTDYTLTYNPGAALWESAGTIPVAAGGGPIPIELKWEETKGAEGGETCKTGGGNKCKGTFGTVQRAFGASTARSGPLKVVQVLENGAAGANSFERCGTCTHDLVVRIGVTGSLQNAADVSDPPVQLRVTGGSQNQSLDCDPAQSNLKSELANGCGPKYEINTGTACPDGTEPFNCVPVQTGGATNQVPAGMNLRVLGAEKPASCTSPSNWSSFPDIPPGDPRIIQVFLTPFGSFNGSGNTAVPVTNFATFYVTGWAGSGGGFANPCEGEGDDPAEDGYIVGHFIQYIQSINDGDSGEEPCDFSAFGSCVPVLTE